MDPAAARQQHTSPGHINASHHTLHFDLPSSTSQVCLPSHFLRQYHTIKASSSPAMPITYNNVPTAGGGAGTLFQDMTFWVAQRVSGRSEVLHNIRVSQPSPAKNFHNAYAMSQRQMAATSSHWKRMPIISSPTPSGNLRQDQSASHGSRNQLARESCSPRRSI